MQLVLLLVIFPNDQSLMTIIAATVTATVTGTNSFASRHRLPTPQ
jgi:hypothetical protein